MQPGKLIRKHLIKPVQNEGFRTVSQIWQAAVNHKCVIKPVQNEGFRTVSQIWQAAVNHKTL